MLQRAVLLNARIGAVLTALLLSIGLCVEAAPPRSGFEYLDAANRALQQDPFANPGQLWVEQGNALWEQSPAAAQSCHGCHGDIARMAGVVNRYPQVDASTGSLLNLELRINRCRSEQQRQPPWKYGSQDLLAITAAVAFQSRGDVWNVPITAPLEPYLARGRALYYQRLGQLNLACHHCHELNAGKRLRGETISEGHLNGYPAYRQTWQALRSGHELLKWCNEAVRAEPFPLGSTEYLNLELFLADRGRGLLIEAPAVRR